MFWSTTCCRACLFVDFCVSDSNDNATSIVLHDNGFLFYCIWFKVAHSKSTRHIGLVYGLDNGYTVIRIIKNVKIF